MSKTQGPYSGDLMQHKAEMDAKKKILTYYVPDYATLEVIWIDDNGYDVGRTVVRHKPGQDDYRPDGKFHWPTGHPYDGLAGNDY